MPIDRKFFYWTQKGFWAVADQAFFAGANFLLNILLARWLTTNQFGKFAALYSVIFLIGTVHTALITEPMLVYGPKSFADCFFDYLSFLSYFHIFLIFSINIILGLISLLFFPKILPIALFIFLSSPFIFYMWLLRRVFYLKNETFKAAQGSFIYLLSSSILLFTLEFFHHLSEKTAFLILGGASFSASLFLFFTLQKGKPGLSSQDNFSFKKALQKHWEYGKWAISWSILQWVPNNLHYVILPLILNLSAAAVFRALQNLVMPILNVMGALSLFLLPRMSEGFKEKKGKNIILNSLLGLLFLASSYFVFLLISKSFLLKLLYKSKYSSYSSLVFLFGLFPLASSFNVVFGNALRAMNLPKYVFISYMASSIVTILTVPSFTLFMGLRGTVIASFLSALTIGITSLAFFRKLTGGIWQ